MPIIEEYFWPWKTQLISIGKSPSAAAHTVWAESPDVNGSSPNENGTIFGGTEQRRTQLFDNLLFFSYSDAEVSRIDDVSVWGRDFRFFFFFLIEIVRFDSPYRTLLN